jgi:excisionase family DNA binding protein
MKLYNLVYVAQTFCVTRQTVLNWVNTGYIKAAKVGRKYLVPESEIKRLLGDLWNEQEEQKAEQ